VGSVLMGVFGYVQSINTNKTQIAQVAQAEKNMDALLQTIGKAEATAEQQKELTALQETITKGVTVYPGINVTYIILGAVLGAFVYVFIFFVLYVMNNKIKVTDDLKELYDITQLGLVVEQRKSKKFLGKIDDGIIYLRDRNKRAPAEVKSLKLAYVAVKLAAKKVAVDTIYLVGCDIHGHSQYVCEQLKGALEKDEINAVILNNVLYDAQTMSQLEHAQAVVLVELAGSTTYKEILRELELMQRQEIQVLGGIVVG